MKMDYFNNEMLKRTVRGYKWNLFYLNFHLWMGATSGINSRE